MKTYLCMIEGAYGRLSRLTKKFKARDKDHAWEKAQFWCSSKGYGYDIIELSVLENT